MDDDTVRDLIADLERRANAAEELCHKADKDGDRLAAYRCAGKAATYQHAAILLRQALEWEAKRG